MVLPAIETSGLPGNRVEAYLAGIIMATDCSRDMVGLDLAFVYGKRHYPGSLESLDLLGLTSRLFYRLFCSSIDLDVKINYH